MHPLDRLSILFIATVMSACSAADSGTDLIDDPLPVLLPDGSLVDAGTSQPTWYDSAIPSPLGDSSAGLNVVSDGSVFGLDGAAADASTGSDASTGRDSGSAPMDASSALDAATNSDSSIPLDAGQTDAQSPLDGSKPQDAEVVRDAGTPQDAGTSGPRTPPASKLPQISGACPTLTDGTVSVGGAKVKLWVGPKAGPMVFYFHGTGTTPDEVQQGLPGSVDDIKRNGGIIASWDTTNAQGDSTGSFWTVWYTGDFAAADQLLACAIQRNLVDTARIHVAGYSAGGLQTGAMMFMRSNYLASGVVYSGGKGFGAQSLQDPSNVPAGVMAHGKKGQDNLVLDFSDWTHNLGTELKTAGGFEIECDDGGGHVSATRLGVGGKAWQFLKDHPYQTKPSPYAGGLPSGWPSYCGIM